MWQKVVKDPKLLLLVLVIFFAIVFFWDRGFEPEGVFFPPDLEPGISFIDHKESEKFNLSMDISIEQIENNLYDFYWVLDFEPVLDFSNEIELYGMLPLEIEEYYTGEDIFPTWLRQENNGDLFIEEHRVLRIEESEKQRIAEIAGWLKIIIFWEEGEEYLEIRIPRDEIKW